MSTTSRENDAVMTTSTGSITLSTGGGADASGASGSDAGAESSRAASDPNAVMNEKVQALAGSVYEEFESLMGRYGADALQNLMPLMVSVLESLDLAYTEAQELEVEAELLKEDNEQLVTQYEREKQLRKAAEARLIEVEDSAEGERKEAAVKLESLTSIVKMFELKAKNSQEQIARLDEKESEMKREYATLHDRYTELFKTHIDYMERTKSMLGAERLEQHMASAAKKIPQSLAVHQASSRSSGPVSFGYSELENNNSAPSEDFSSNQQQTGNTLKNELQSPGKPRTTADKAADAESDYMVLEERDLPQAPKANPTTPSHHPAGSSHTKAETRTGNTLYQELSFQDSDVIGEVDEGADITDNESNNGDDRGFDDNVNDNYFGMGKEVENLISENNELLATKNALNIVKDDLIAKVDELTGEHEILREEVKSLQGIRSRLESRIQELEEELKRVKEEAEKATKANKSDDEEEIPLAQRKRFTRVEMARVLMDRNQYKEKYMELQEAVRWTEMIRASKTTESPMKGGQRGIWKFFGNLFSGAERGGPTEALYMKYNSAAEPSGSVAAGTASRGSRRAMTSSRSHDIFDGDTISSESRQGSGPRRGSSSEGERKEQYRQVRAHVNNKEDGRMQAYGWSLPAKQPAQTTAPTQATSQSSTETIQVQSRTASQGVSVPVPVYCRPLMEKEPGMKIWCGAGVNLSGGRTPDGGEVVGRASVFYHEPPTAEKKNEGASKEVSEAVEQLDSQLEEATRSAVEAAEAHSNLSSNVWICTSTHAISKVTVIDANSPADVLESFHVCSSHLLCISSVPGAMEDDYKVDEELNKLALAHNEEDDPEVATGSDAPGVDGPSGIGAVSFVSCATGQEEVAKEDEEEKETLPRLTKETAIQLGSKFALNRTLDVIQLQELSDDPDPHATLPFISHHTLNISRDLEDRDSSKTTPEVTTPDAVHPRFSQSASSSSLKVDLGGSASQLGSGSEKVPEEEELMSSVLPTIWLGSQSGSIYVHSAVAQWKKCIHSIRLKDSVLCIVHVKGRVLAALANGSVAIFHRSSLDGQWDLTNYHLLDLGKPHHSIRTMVQVHNKVWCGYRNRVYVIDPRTMQVTSTFDAHPRKESQVRQMAWVGDGVWISIRLDSTLRLYHAHTHQHLQDVDIEPYVSKMLGTGKLGFSFVRITALLVSNFRLWMGTGNGVIISVPLEGKTKPEVANLPGEPVRIYEEEQGSVITPETFIPYCNMAHAQLSFHGHRDSVKFFVSVPGHGGLALNPTSSPIKESDPTKEASSMLVMSGGEGYIDFRIGEPEAEDSEHPGDPPGGSRPKGLTRGDLSHLIVWQVPIIKKKFNL